MKYNNILEEEIKNKVEHDFFGIFDCTEIIRDSDFAVKIKHDKNLLSFKNLTGLDDEYFFGQKQSKNPQILSQCSRNWF
jgi:hypothetical protein